MRFYARVAGAESLRNRLRQAGGPAKLEAALDAAALIVERDATRNAPVDEGEMRAGIFIERMPAARAVGTDAPHAVYTEFSQRLLKGGTVENPRQGPWPYEDRNRSGGRRPKLKGTRPNAKMPWLRPSLWDNRARISRLIGTFFKWSMNR